MNFLLVLKSCLFYNVIAFNPDPSHFRIIPLSFYTPDNRNDQYFKNPNYYGVRIAWIASKPPSETIIINNNDACIHLNWQVKGLFNAHKNNWDNILWDYSFVDTALLVGKHSLVIDKWTYNINIPRFGSKLLDDDTTFFIGDANIGGSTRWALGDADTVIKSKLLAYENISSLIVWLGDIFYHDSPNIITKEWPKLTSVNNGIVKGVPNYLHLSVLGNHDYTSSTACHSCKWYIKRDGLSCSSNIKS